MKFLGLVFEFLLHIQSLSSVSSDLMDLNTIYKLSISKFRSCVQEPTQYLYLDTLAPQTLQGNPSTPNASTTSLNYHQQPSSHLLSKSQLFLLLRLTLESFLTPFLISHPTFSPIANLLVLSSRYNQNPAILSNTIIIQATILLPRFLEEQ